MITILDSTDAKHQLTKPVQDHTSPRRRNFRLVTQGSRREVDLRVRAHPIFRGFLGHVTPPTVLSMSDFQLLEGIAEWGGDFIDIIRDWRAASAHVPTPLQVFLDQDS